MRMKHYLAVLFVGVTFCALAHPSAQMHGNELGTVLGICDASGTPRNKSLQGRTTEFGEIFSALIDNPTGCAKILREINDEIYNICSDESNVGAYRDVREKELRELQGKLQNVSSVNVSPNQLQNLIAIASSLQDVPGMDAEVSNIKYELQNIKQRAEDAGGRLNFQEQQKLDAEIMKLKKIAEDFKVQTVFLKEELRCLKDGQRFFSYGKYGHRLFFHWGWKQNIKDFKPLQNRVNATKQLLKKYLKPDSADLQIKTVEEHIYQKLNEEWEARKKDARGNLELNLKKCSQARLDTLLAVGYTVHILGDYSDTEIDALADIEEIKNLLANEICSNKQYVWDFKDKKNRIQLDALSASIRDCHGKSAPQQARNLLELLKKELPKIIGSTNKMKYLLWLE